MSSYNRFLLREDQGQVYPRCRHEGESDHPKAGERVIGEHIEEGADEDSEGETEEQENPPHVNVGALGVN